MSERKTSGFLKAPLPHRRVNPRERKLKFSIADRLFLLLNRHPAQESIQGAVEELPKIFRFAADAGEGVGAACGVTTYCFFGSGGKAEGTGGCAANARRNTASLSVSITTGPHPKYSAFGERRGWWEPGFSFLRRIIFGQQPPKQPLAQNKNGSRFGCLASC